MAMGGFGQYSDIILFAMIAVFLVLRLRSVLGRRTGNERQPPRNLFVRRAAPGPQPPAAAAEPAAAAVVPALGGDAVGSGLGRIRRADPRFDAEEFLVGARVAFEMIVAAFAKSEKATLKPLLSDEVFRSFAAAIDQRLAAKETLETRILALRNAEIAEADLVGSVAQVTVKFVSEQVNVTRAEDGSVVDGSPDQAVEKTDFWTFARDTRSADPNWVLIATNSG
jgi:predicted lipid-binding transport protein (Tim44 family)